MFFEKKILFRYSAVLRNKFKRDRVENMMKNSVISTSPYKTMIPIIKIVGDFCNLRCDYCFYNGKNQSSFCIMSDGLLEKFISQYMNLFSQKLVFIWHGGEPLLAGISFFQKVIDLQKKYFRDGHKIQNSIQTNATLIDDKWARFFKKHDFRIGISLDGSKKSHNRFRKDKKNKGSFDRAMKGIRFLQRYKIKPGIIQTLTYDNAVRIKEDFNFFVNILGIKGWGINIYRDMENKNKVMTKQSITNKELTEFLKTCIDLWLVQDDPNLRIREIENFIFGVFGKMARNCTFNGACTTFFCLEYDGRIYPCDRLSGRPDFLFGDLSQQSLLEVLNGLKRLKYAKDVNFIHSDCVTCEWHKACHNGCAMYRVQDIKGKYYYCETRKKIFDYLKERIKTIIQ